MGHFNFDRSRVVVVERAQRRVSKDAIPIGSIDPRIQLEVTIRLKRRRSVITPEEIIARGQLLLRDEFLTLLGADPENMLVVEAFAQEYDLVILQSSLVERSVRMRGTAANLQRAFGVRLANYKQGRTRYRDRIGDIFVPDTLAPLIDGVFGLDNRPQLRPHFRTLKVKHDPVRPIAPLQGTFVPCDVAKIYNFPNGNGDGQCIALIEVGGGYSKSDLETYFGRLGIPIPSITAVSVLGASNAPIGLPNSLDAEVALDIQVAGSIAPGARLVVYFAPNTEEGFLTAISAAVHDELRTPSVISVSYGSPEKEWTAQAIENINATCQDAAILGITICASAGNEGASDVSPPVDEANVDFPASSPYVLGCGGTRLIANQGTVCSEIVWNEPSGGATGGGISDLFDLPAYQIGIDVPKSVNPNRRVGRGVPDVAGNADPKSGYRVRVNGEDRVLGGTSAVAPLWAAFIAIVNQLRKESIGFPHPVLYGIAKERIGFRDIIEGNNGVGPCPGYSANAGWNPCAGWGVPDGIAIMTAILNADADIK